MPGVVAIWSSYLGDTSSSIVLFCYEEGFDIDSESRFFGVSVRGVLGAGPSPGPIDPGIPIEPIG
jgi:hypothetical protein